MKNCHVALKEWAVTIAALEQGRQVVLLRKGGLLDPATDVSQAGTFSFEYSNFWLLPTHLHQDEKLVKPEHFDLFRTARDWRDAQQKEFLSLHLWARVERVWRFSADDAEVLANAPHIWSDSYLDLRLGYKPDEPLLCGALRVFCVPQSVRVAWQTKFGGCRSWIETDEALSLENAQPILNDAEFARQLAAFENSISRFGQSFSQG